MDIYGHLSPYRIVNSILFIGPDFFLYLRTTTCCQEMVNVEGHMYEDRGTMIYVPADEFDTARECRDLKLITPNQT